MRHSNVDAAHLTLALLDCDTSDLVQQLLEVRAIKRDELRLYVQALLNATDQPARGDAEPQPVAAVGAMLRNASKQASDYNEPQTQNALLLIALVAQKSANGEVLRSLGLQPNELRVALRNITRAANANGNPLKMLDADAQNALDAAHQIMRATYCGRISTVHLLLGILQNREVYVLQRLADEGVDLDELGRLARAAIANDGTIATPQLRLAPATKRALDRARDIAPNYSRLHSIAPQALLWALLPHPTTLRE